MLLREPHPRTFIFRGNGTGSVSPYLVHTSQSLILYMCCRSEHIQVLFCSPKNTLVFISLTVWFLLCCIFFFFFNSGNLTQALALAGQALARWAITLVLLHNLQSNVLKVLIYYTPCQIHSSWIVGRERKIDLGEKCMSKCPCIFSLYLTATI